METYRGLAFGDYRLDLTSERLWCQDEVVALTPKAFAVLRRLVEEGGQLVSKEELLRAGWAKTHVSEMAEALEALTATTPVLLVLEDLHWSDYSTVDLLAMLARRQEPARLLVIGSDRSLDVIMAGHPLRALIQDLRVRRPGRGPLPS